MRTSTLLLAALLVIVAGCSDTSVTPVPPSGIGDVGFSLIPEIHVDRIVPAQFTPDSTVSVTISCQCRYAGTGWVSLFATGDGQIGRLLEPSDASLGQYTYKAIFPAGRYEVPLRILMTTSSLAAGLDVHVSCDSLIAGDALVHWMSPEGHAVWGPDLPPDCAWVFHSAYVHVTIPKVGQSGLN